MRCPSLRLPNLDIGMGGNRQAGQGVVSNMIRKSAKWRQRTHPALIVATLTIAGAAVAQTFSGNRIEGILIRPESGPIGKLAQRSISLPHILSSSSLCALIGNPADQARAVLFEKARGALGPFGLHSQTRVTISGNCIGRAETITSGTTRILVSVKHTGNTVRARFTTPGPIPGGLDPVLTGSFDLETLVEIGVPPDTSKKFEVTSSHSRTSSVRQISASNITGELVVAGRAVFKIFTNDDFLAKYTQAQGFTPKISVPLGSLNTYLARYPGFRLEPSYSGDVLVLKRTRRPETQIEVH